MSTYTLVHDADSFQIKAANLSRQSVALTQTGLAIMAQQDIPRCFLREEFYTFHILGYLHILEVFLAPYARIASPRTKLVLQYLQTPYMIATLNKLAHYKSHFIQTKATLVLGSLLDLLSLEMQDPLVLKERAKPKPCTAILIFSRNFELL